MFLADTAFCIGVKLFVYIFDVCIVSVTGFIYTENSAKVFVLFMLNITENLNWRYATKSYDTTKKLSDEQRQAVLDALRLAPSSMGLQPMRRARFAAEDVIITQ